VAAPHSEVTSTSTPSHLVSIVRSGLSVVADAMGIAVIRAAFSTTIKGGADVSSGLFDQRGRLVALSDTSMIGHLAPLRCGVRSILEDFPASAMAPGDVFLMNDPYRGGVHSNDIQVFRPIYVDGQPRFFAGTMVHVADIGGTAPGGLSGTVTDIFQEGLVLPPVRLYAGGAIDSSTLKILAANTRTPEVTLGDVHALVAGTFAGEREFQAFVNRLGHQSVSLDSLIDGIEQLFAYTERRARLRIGQLRPGSYEGSAVIDDDGVRLDEPLTVRVRVTVNATAMTLDFSGTDPQAVGPINAAEGPAISAAIYGARVLLDDPELPVNEGMFVPFTIIRPEGSLVAPRRPGATNARGFTMLAVIDAITSALADGQPRRAMAGSGLNHVMTLSSLDSEGRTHSYHDRDYGGTGARFGAPGVDAHGYAVFAGRANTVSMEVIEAEHPVRFESHRIRPASGGNGEWRGGNGVEKTLRMLADGNLTVRADRIQNPPKGVAGGSDGEPGGWIINRGAPNERRLRSKETNIHLDAGDTLTMLTSGGGGFGIPDRTEGSS
jgi:N-methylhydantoinase B